jgi:hypothetical protein
MQKKVENKRRNSKAFFSGAIALISFASMTFSPLAASAQTPFDIKTATQSITTPLTTSTTSLVGGLLGGGTTTNLTNSGGLLGGVTGAVGGVVGGVTGAVGGVVGTVGEVIQDPAGSVTEIIKDPTSVVEKITDPLLNPQTNPGNTPVQTPTTGGQTTNPVPGVGQVTDTLKDPTKVVDQVTDVLTNPTQIGDKIKDTIGSLPGEGSGELPGAVNVNLMAKEILTGSLHKSSGDKYKLYLNYSGTPAVGVKLLSKTYVFFHMPEEFTSLLASDDFKKSVKASYTVPVIGSSGPSAVNAGRFADSAIKIDTATNSIVLEHSDSLSLSLSSASHFSIEIDLEKLPASKDKVYSFVSTAYDKNAIKLDLLETKGARADVEVPDDGGKDPGKDDDNNGKDPDGSTPGTGGGDNGNGPGGDRGGNTGGSEGKNGSGSFSDWLGNTLPKTASNIWNIGLIGMILILVGAAMKFNNARKLI